MNPFWNEVYNIKYNNDTQAARIDNETDHDQISEIFSEKYKKIFAMRTLPPIKNYITCGNMNGNFSFSKMDIIESIRKLKCGIGIDGIHSNHLKNCSDSFTELITNIFTSFFFIFMSL